MYGLPRGPPAVSAVISVYLLTDVAKNPIYNLGWAAVSCQTDQSSQDVQYVEIAWALPACVLRLQYEAATTKVQRVDLLFMYVPNW